MSEFKIKITSGEGRNNWVFPLEFDTFTQASCLLAERAIELRREFGNESCGYWKTDFEVIKNGEMIYKGRYDLRPYGETDEGTVGPDLFEHIRGFLRFTTGEKKPSHMTEAQYTQYLDSCGRNDKTEVDEFLADIEQCK